MEFGILLITYKRSEYLDSIIQKIKSFNLPIIFYQNISNENCDSYKKVETILKKNLASKNIIKLLRPEKILNVNESIVFAINYSANIFDYTFVIEDDISVTKITLDTIQKCIRLFNKNVASISLYSPFIPKQKLCNEDHILLKSQYGHSWGWILNSYCWRDFNQYKKYDPFTLSDILNPNFLFRKLAYNSLSNLARRKIIVTWDYQWNIFCQSKGLIHYKFVPTITKHLGNRDDFAMNSVNSIQNDSIYIDLPKNNFLYENGIRIIDNKKFDLMLLINHHDLNFFKSFLLIILSKLPKKIVLGLSNLKNIIFS